ncbi:RagB/SusD family nutrient uptake outer membrane protein [Ornithobacterium rhinotracheale]
MKKIIITILALFTIYSCQDYLNVKPENVMTVSSYQDVKSLLGGHLKSFQDGDTGQALSNVPIFFSDNMDYLITHFYSDDYDLEKYLDNYMGRNNRGDFQKSQDWKHPDINEQIWKTGFKSIGFYNMVLFELDKVKASEDERNIIKGEVKTLRAWNFFRLLQFFSPYHNNSLGLPLNTNPDKVGDYDKSRKSQVENYDFIINELEEVLNYKTKPKQGYNIFYDKKIVHALLAQVYLYKGDSGAKAATDYEKAIAHAQKAMEGRLSLEEISRNPTENESYGINKEKTYSLLSFMYNDTNRIFNLVGMPAWGMFQYASDELFSLFDENDKRTDLYFNKDKGILKFESEFQYSYCKWDFFTASEMQLIIAESYARKGDEENAKRALKVFTDSRYNKYLSKENLSTLDKILIERRKEFCFDYCMRWIDLTRLQKGFKHKSVGKKNEQKEFFELSDGDFRFCMPIPKSGELQNNKIEQNPGWGNF